MLYFDDKTPWTGQDIGEVRYPLAIEYAWSDEALAAIGLHREVLPEPEPVQEPEPEPDDRIMITGLGFPVTISALAMQIGCEVHPIEDWRGYDNATIAAMDATALAFWQANKAAIFAVIDARPA